MMPSSNSSHPPCQTHVPTGVSQCVQNQHESLDLMGGNLLQNIIAIENSQSGGKSALLQKLFDLDYVQAGDG